jgi:hypothetical protein
MVSLGSIVHLFLFSLKSRLNVPYLFRIWFGLNINLYSVNTIFVQYSSNSNMTNSTSKELNVRSQDPLL